VMDLHKAIRQDMLEESAEKLDGVEMGRTWAGTAHLTGGEEPISIGLRSGAITGCQCPTGIGSSHHCIKDLHEICLFL
jgi:hypothetical protein